MERFDFVNRANAEYIDRLYEQYQRDPRSIDVTWQAYFAGFEYAEGKNFKAAGNAPQQKTQAASGPGVSEQADRQALERNAHIGIYDLVHSYRELGHFIADLDPLGRNRANHPLLELSEFNLTPADLDHEVGAGPFQGKTDGTLRDLIDKLRATYCRTLGVQYME